MKANNPTSSPWKFFGLTFLFTWACWIPAGLSYFREFSSLTSILHYAGGLMPTLVALFLLYRYKDPEGRKDYWRRLIDFKRIGKVWYGVIFITIPLLTIIGITADIILGGKGADLETARGFIQSPLSLIPFAVFIFLFGPLPEEMAWRGYALDGLQSKWNALTTSLILGAAWTIWHLPLFFIDGTYQNGLGIGTAQFWLYMLDKIPQSVLMTWIYNNTNKSITSAVLFHFMVNLVGELLDLSLQGEIFYIASLWVMAFLVTAVWKPQNLIRSDPDS
jgi:membrane protease YdiL (CAAX protease family)